MASRDVLDVLVKFRADTKQAKTSVDNTTKSVDKLSKSLKGAGAALAGFAGGAAAKGALDFMNNLAQAADSIGLSVESLQELRFAGRSAGLQVEELDDIMTSFVERLGDARQGGNEAAEAIERLNVRLDDGRGGMKSTEQVLYEVADAFRNMNDAQLEVFTAQQLFESDAATRFLNVLRQGSAAMEEMRQRARELGVVLSEDMIRKGQQAAQELGTLSFVLRNQWNRGVAELAPLLAKAGETFVDVATLARRTWDYWTGGAEDAKKATDDVVESAEQVSESVMAMNKTVQESMEETQKALSEGAPREVQTLADAAAIRLEAARAINNREFDTAAAKLQEYNRALVTLRNRGSESSGILRGMFIQGQALAGTLATASRTAAPTPSAAMTAPGAPMGELIPRDLSRFTAAAGVGTAGLGAGQPGRIETSTQGPGQVMQFVPNPPTTPLDERTVARGGQRVRGTLHRQGMTQITAEMDRQAAMAARGGLEVLVDAVGGFFAGVASGIQNPARSIPLYNELAKASREHGPQN